MPHALMVADPGGHLALLSWLRPELDGWRVSWVSLDRPDVRGRVGNDPVVFGHGPTARSLGALLRNLRHARHALPSLAPDLVLTSGAGLGVPWVWAASALGIPTAFLEVADRAGEPSLSARLVAPFVRHRLVQEGPGGIGRVHPPAVQRGGLRDGPILVALGTGPHPFERLVRGAEALAEAGHDVLAQHGSSRAPRGCRSVARLGPDRFRDALQRARVVVVHGGLASRAEAAALGRVPLVVPRRAHLGEHVDDHQWEASHRDGAEVVEPEHLVEVVGSWEEPAATPVDDAEARARFRAWLARQAPPST